MDTIGELIGLLFDWIQQLGALGIMLGLMVEVIPSEIVLAYGGYLVGEGKVGFGVAVVCGVVGGTLAQLLLYAVGRYGGRPFLDKYGKWLHIGGKHLDRSEEWFRKYGPAMIFFARFVPVIRHAISIPAGVSRMSWSLFTLLTALAAIPWTLLFLYLGMRLGESWDRVHEAAAPYVQPLTLTILALALVYVVVRFVRSRGQSL
ncbi:DedA family protein [Paenibacillus sp. 598K]|uniref:DedA family protein n=1 Tax=Paenibacillus sp. 598K TaxID=1117987 RepID=UPI000FFAB65A|nr:DedA family protein [Paenibacillus sp. 598K]GBF78286.1 DedA family protein [Paenibacillus sp. 598K]